MEDRTLRFLSYVSVTCAVAVTLLLASDRFFNANRRSSPRTKPVEVTNWTDLASGGHKLGPSTAEIFILEFGDYQCPFCRRFEQVTWPALQAKFPGKVGFIYRHWPLPNHKHAREAAKAAECAGHQGQFAPFHSRLYEFQDSIGRKPMQIFAKESGVPDLKTFASCLASADVDRVIDADIAAALSLNPRGTPTIVVDGLRFFVPPDTTTLYEVVKQRLVKKR